MSSYTEKYEQSIQLLAERQKQNLSANRLSFAETWELLQTTTNLIGDDQIMPENEEWIGIAYQNEPEINIPAEGEEYDLWRLDNLTMPGGDFFLCGLADMSFRNTNLTASGFMCSELIDVDFTEADLSSSNMRGTIFDNVQFVRTNLRDTDFRQSRFDQCDFTDAEMTGTKMTRSQASNLVLSEKQKAAIIWMRGSGRLPKMCY